MNDAHILDIPEAYFSIKEKTEEVGFSMPSDPYIGTLLKTLVASKPGGHFLELGTGTGLSLSWMIEGMDENSKVISVDNNADLQQIATEALGKDSRVHIVCEDGEKWIQQYQGRKFDLIFADAWPGKYNLIEKTLDLLHQGGLYVIDDMLPQPNWPQGHQEKVAHLIGYLEERKDLHLTKMNWSTGLVIVTKR